MMDKDQKEALQVAKELTCKLIENRSVSVGNLGDVFSSIFKDVYRSILDCQASSSEEHSK